MVVQPTVTIPTNKPVLLKETQQKPGISQVAVPVEKLKELLKSPVVPLQPAKTLPFYGITSPSFKMLPEKPSKMPKKIEKQILPAHDRHPLKRYGYNS